MLLLYTRELHTMRERDYNNELEDPGTKSTEKEHLEGAAMMEFVHLPHIIILDLDKWLEL